MAYGWLSFSFKYKYLNKLYNLYNELLIIDENIFYHDDLVFTIFYKNIIYILVELIYFFQLTI